MRRSGADCFFFWSLRKHQGKNEQKKKWYSRFELIRVDHRVSRKHIDTKISTDPVFFGNGNSERWSIRKVLGPILKPLVASNSSPAILYASIVRKKRITFFTTSNSNEAIVVSNFNGRSVKKSNSKPGLIRILLNQSHWRNLSHISRIPILKTISKESKVLFLFPKRCQSRREFFPIYYYYVVLNIGELSVRRTPTWIILNMTHSFDRRIGFACCFERITLNKIIQENISRRIELAFNWNKMHNNITTILNTGIVPVSCWELVTGESPNQILFFRNKQNNLLIA